MMTWSDHKIEFNVSIAEAFYCMFSWVNKERVVASTSGKSCKKMRGNDLHVQYGSFTKFGCTGTV